MKKTQNITFLFPGQGAQVVGMGKDFCESFSIARETFEEGDALLSRELSKTIFEGPLETLTETRNSQTGIYLVSLAIFRVLQEQFPSLKPTLCAGLSLGEYTALTASGRIPFVHCLPLVENRGAFMNAACAEVPGSMAAVLGLSATEVEAMVAKSALPHDLWVANFNCPGQTVISGTLKGIEAGMQAAKACGAKRTIPLRVHGAFHSGLMASARERLAPKIASVELVGSAVGLVMNVPGARVEELDQIRQNLIDQVTHPVRWEQGIHSIKEETDLFIEVGPGQTLSGFNKKIGVEAPTIAINKVADLENLAKMIG